MSELLTRKNSLFSLASTIKSKIIRMEAMANGEVILYTTEDGEISIKLQADEGTIWLTQLEMSSLFQTSKQNISLHIKNILSEGELTEAVV